MQFGAKRAAARELWQALMVSLAVAMGFTVAASVFDQFHQVAAEDLNVHAVQAQSMGKTQVLKIGPWGVQLTMPLGPDMPRMSFAVQSPDSVGLSSAALARFGSKCSAARNGVGALVRLNRETWSQHRWGYPLGSYGGYEYVYAQPQNACAGAGNIGPAADVVDYEAMAIQGVGVLAPSQ